MDRVKTFMTHYSHYFPDEYFDELDAILLGLNEMQFKNIESLKYRNPKISLLLSILLGFLGIDRFYAGNLSLGIIKLLFCWATFGIWWLLDIFFIVKATKRLNYETFRIATFVSDISYTNKPS